MTVVEENKEGGDSSKESARLFTVDFVVDTAFVGV